MQGALGEVEDLIALLDLDIGQLRTDRCGHIAGQGPGGGGPHQQGFTLATAQGEAQGDAAVGELGVAIGDDLMLADGGGAARAPGHHIRAAVQPALLPAFLQEGPDHEVVFVGEGEIAASQLGQTQATDDLLDGVGDRSIGTLHSNYLGGVFQHAVGQPAQLIGIVPVHPVTQADGLLGLYGGITQDTRLTFAHKLLQAELLDVFLGGKAHFLFDFNFHPQTLAIKAVLVAQFLAAHGLEAQEQVFIGAPPAVMHAHRVVGGDGSIDEGPVGVVLV